jgi:hypothetical protein
MKKLLLLWFDKKYATQPFSMHGNVHIFDRLMMEIKPTVNCSRPPRPISTIGKLQNFVVFGPLCFKRYFAACPI